MYSFRDWVSKNLRPGDAVLLETAEKVWDVYDIVAPLVTKAIVAHAGKVCQIAEARVKRKFCKPRLKSQKLNRQVTIVYKGGRLQS